MSRDRTARALHGGEPCAGSQNVMFMPEGYDVETLVAEVSCFGRIGKVETARAGVWVVVTCEGGDRCWCRSSQVSTRYRLVVMWRRWWRNLVSWRP